MLATCSEARLRENKVWEQSRKTGLITDPETTRRPSVISHSSSNLSFHWLAASLQPGGANGHPNVKERCNGASLHSSLCFVVCDFIQTLTSNQSLM